MRALQTSKLLWFAVNLQSRCLTWAAALRNKGILLLGLCYFDGGRLVILGFIIRRFGVLYAMGMVSFVRDGMYRDRRIVGAVDRIQL